MRTPILAILVNLPLEWNIYLLFNSDIVNFVWKSNEGKGGGVGGRQEADSNVLLIFALDAALIVGG